jgi:membrane fusion protein (multidrug efflux system)
MASLAGPRLAARFRPGVAAHRPSGAPRLPGRFVRLTLACAAAFLAGVELAAAQSAAQPQTAAVVVAPAARKPVTPTATFTARVEAIDKVELRARVEGYLEKRFFADGQFVKEGDLLYQIEEKEYQAKVNQASANVASAEAGAVNASLQLARGRELLKKDNIPAAVVDERIAKDEEAKASVLQAKAALEEATINLGYTKVFAPQSGQVGRSVYSVGNYVGRSSGTLATIVSRDPMYVTFPVTQRELLSLRKMAEERNLDRSAVKVRLQLADQSFYAEYGTIDFLGIQVSAGTDTVTARASVPNPKGLLIDGQLVTAVAELGEPQLALFIPQQAIQFDQGGYSVLVVDGENKVKVRRVTLGPGREGEVQIASGLEEGERVIVDGIQKVRPNQVVQIAEAAPPGQAK